MVNAITMEGAKIKGQKMGLTGEDLDLFIEKTVYKVNPSGARPEVMPFFTGNKSMLGLFVQSRLKTVDWVIQKGIEGDWSALVIWAMHAMVIGAGLSWLFGKRVYQSKKTGKSYVHPVLEALEFIDPVDFRRMKDGFQKDWATGLGQFWGGMTSPYITFFMHLMGWRTPTDRVYNLDRKSVV